MLKLVVSYFKWHYTRGFVEIMNHTRNAVVFFFHFFGVRALFKALFSPWKMLGERYKKGLNIEAFFETFVVNTLMRLFGFIVRSFFILVGLCSTLAAFLIGAAFFVLWAFVPLLILNLFIVGLRLLVM